MQRLFAQIRLTYDYFLINSTTSCQHIPSTILAIFHLSSTAPDGQMHARITDHKREASSSLHSYIFSYNKEATDMDARKIKPPRAVLNRLVAMEKKNEVFYTQLKITVQPKSKRHICCSFMHQERYQANEFQFCIQELAEKEHLNGEGEVSRRPNTYTNLWQVMAHSS